MGRMKESREIQEQGMKKLRHKMCRVFSLYKYTFLSLRENLGMHIELTVGGFIPVHPLSVTKAI